jgi:hypothetical protein
MDLIAELGKKFAAAGGKKLSEGGTAAQNVAILNSLGMGDFQTISGGGLFNAVADILPGGGGTNMVDPVMSFEPSDLLTGPAVSLSSLISSGLGIIQNLTAPQELSPLEQLIPPILRGQGGLQQRDTIEAGITASASQFPGRCKPARRKLKIVINPATGQPMVVAACPPRRMNPLNPRALGRAARRLGSFQRIASHIEKTIQKACRTKSRRSSSRSYCPPSRCR